ncbi:MAG: RNB domain-containing ribonuclease [Spirochaetaceae bacterium]|jgi:exoribonuclease-2|nr:RNB domain-containing ribonuclease [Spirochaetaceae bacterium]
MFSEKNLVLYKNQPARVLQRDGDKYLIETLSGEKKVRDKDIVLLHSGSLTKLKDVYDHTDRIFSSGPELLQRKKALEEAWELLDGAGSSFAELAELVSSDYSPSEAWTLYRLFQETPWFAGDVNGFTPRTAEQIQAIQNKEAEKGREQEIRQEFMERLKKKQIQLPEDGKFMQDIEALALGKSDKSKTMKEAGFKETPEKAHKLLLDTAYWPITRNPHPSRYGLSVVSADDCLASPPEEERLDLTAMTSWAVDNEWSSDPDDAVSFDGTYLWVHIADPASTVLPDSPIDTAARNRGATLYIPEGAARMLAEESLEDYALGLTPVSRALSFRILLDESGAVIDSGVFKTLIRVNRATYSQADAMKDDLALAPLFAIADRNFERREKAGAVSIELPEVHISVTAEEGEPQVRIEGVERFHSADMVREMMLLAGEAAARFAFKNNLPFLYVSQEQPDIPATLPEGLAGQYRLRRSMKSRRVGVTPSDHAGLGLGMYSQVTSPLRRYGDLIAHQQLRLFLSGEKPLSKDVMLERISMGDAAAQAAVKAERASNLHWTLVWLTQNPDWVGKSIVVEQKDRRVTVFIPELAREAQMQIDSEVELNDTVYVRAANINIPEQTVLFTEA